MQRQAAGEIKKSPLQTRASFQCIANFFNRGSSPPYLNGAELDNPCYLHGANGVTNVFGTTTVKYSRTSTQNGV